MYQPPVTQQPQYAGQQVRTAAPPISAPGMRGPPMAAPPGGAGPPRAGPGGGPPTGMGPGHGMPPPPTGAGGPGRQPQASPPSQPKAQFYSMAGGQPTPTAPAAPPTGPPGTAALTAQFSQASLGPPTGTQSMGAPAVQPGYPGSGAGYGQQQPGYNGTSAPQHHQPTGGMGGAMGGQQPQPSVSQHSQQAQLPSIHEIDMTIQADPRVMTMTVGEIPASSSLHAQCKIPLGVVIQPMALDMDAEDGGCTVVNFGAQGIMRCKRCRTYINPFVSWMNNGRQWRCNVCGMVNDVPSSYFSHLDANGQRRDKEQRAELCNGSVELVAPAEYMVRPPQPPVYMFVIDVSCTAMATGMVGTAVAAIKECLHKLPGDERTQIGFVTFDSSIHFYHLKATLNQPQMLVVPDLADMFLPSPEDLLVNLSESREIVDMLLDNLVAMHQASRNNDCALGSALNAAGKVMAHYGGSMQVFCASLASAGEARLKHRENPRLVGTDKEHILLKAEDPWYQNKAVEFSKLQICVNLYLFSTGYIDVATLTQLPNKTAGQLYYYPQFSVQRDSAKFKSELSHNLTRPTAFEAVMRVRSTRGLRITNFYGNYFIRGTDLLALPNCSPDSVFAVELGYDEQM
ncbi:unnamed protein product [Chrysoparadoxa australica]